MKRLLFAGVLAAGCHALLLMIDTHGAFSRRPLHRTAAPMAVTLVTRQTPMPPPGPPVPPSPSSPQPRKKTPPVRRPTPPPPSPRAMPVRVIPPAPPVPMLPVPQEVAPAEDPQIALPVDPAPPPLETDLHEDITETPTVTAESSPEVTEDSMETAALPAPDIRSQPVAPPIREAVPLYRENAPPPYPGIARRRRLQGTVLLKVLVNASGRVDDIDIDTSSGHAILDTAAVRSVRRWTFEPGKKGDTPTDMWVRIPITFRLDR